MMSDDEIREAAAKLTDALLRELQYAEIDLPADMHVAMAEDLLMLARRGLALAVAADLDAGASNPALDLAKVHLQIAAAKRGETS
jgi:hypothetical protein